MIKIFGFLIVLICCGKIGFDLSGNLRKRTLQLKSFEKGLNIISNEIGFNKSVMWEALRVASTVTEKTVSTLFLCMSKTLEKTGCSTFDAYEKNLNKNRLALKNSDYEILEAFFRSCGEKGIEEEQKNISNTLSALSHNISSASEEESRYGKLVSTGGILAGVLIGILFI